MKKKDFYDRVCFNMNYQNDMMNTSLAINRKSNALKQEDLDTKDRIDISLRDYQKMQDTIEKQKTIINIMKDTLSRILGFTEKRKDDEKNLIKQIICLTEPTVSLTNCFGNSDKYLHLEYRIKEEDIMNYIQYGKIKEIIDGSKE